MSRYEPQGQYDNYPKKEMSIWLAMFYMWIAIPAAIAFIIFVITGG